MYQQINTGRGLKPFQYINLCKTSKRFIVITTDKDECHILVPKTFTCPSSITSILVNKTNNIIKMSGKVVILIGTTPLK